MKFTDGNWMMREGVTVYNPTEAYEISEERSGLTVVAPTHPIRHRGDTLEGPVLTCRFSSPMPDVIRIQVYHYQPATAQVPSYETFEEKGFVPATQVTEDAALLVSGQLSARIARRRGWSVEFTAGDRRLTRSGPRNLGYAQTGAPWLLGYHSTTIYFHVGPPNSRSCMYPSGRIGTAARSAHTGGVNAALCDGSVRFVSNSVALPTWRAMGSMSGSEVVSNP